MLYGLIIFQIGIRRHPENRDQVLPNVAYGIPADLAHDGGVKALELDGLVVVYKADGNGWRFGVSATKAK